MDYQQAGTPFKRPMKRKLSNSNSKADQKLDEHYLKTIVEGLSGNIESLRTKMFQKKLESQKKKQHLAIVKVQREENNKKRSHYRQEFDFKQFTLAAAKEKAKETMDKLYLYNAKAVETEESLAKMKARLAAATADVEQKVTGHKKLTHRATNIVMVLENMRDDMQNTLGKTQQQFSESQKEFADWQREKQAEVTERRREWNEIRDVVDGRRRHKDESGREIDVSRRRLAEMGHQIQENERQAAKIATQTEGLAKKLEFENEIQVFIEENASIRIENEAIANELELIRVDLRSKVIEKRMRREKEETELARELQELSEADERREAERNFHQEKLNKVNASVEERLDELEKVEHESKLQQEARKAEWEAIEKQQEEALTLQRLRFGDLKREIEALAGEQIEPMCFGPDCQAVQNLKSKMKDEREQLVSEMDSLKQQIKAAEIKEPEKATSTKNSVFPQEQAGQNLSDQRTRKIDKHVTFKNTPVVWESVNSQESSTANETNHNRTSQRFSGTSNWLTSSSTAKTGTSAQSSTQIASSKSTPSKNSLAGSGLFSVDSDESLELPKTQALLRKPPPSKTKKSFSPDFLGSY